MSVRKIVSEIIFGANSITAIVRYGTEQDSAGKIVFQRYTSEPLLDDEYIDQAVKSIGEFISDNVEKWEQLQKDMVGSIP